MVGIYSMAGVRVCDRYDPCIYVHVNERCRRKVDTSRSYKQFKAKQHSTPKAVIFPKKNELPRVGLKPTTL